MAKSVGWGWEVVNINNGGEDAILPVANALTLKHIEVDVAFMPTAAPSNGGWAEVLCQGFVLPAAPSAPPKGPAYLNAPASPDFGAPATRNPNGFTGGASGQVSDRVLFSIILKTWVGSGWLAGPVASATARHASIPLDLYIPAGAVIALHMDHMGVPGDVEMQLTIQY